MACKSKPSKKSAPMKKAPAKAPGKMPPQFQKKG